MPQGPVPEEKLMCVLKARSASKPPHRGDGDGICSLMRHHLGSRAPSVAFGGDNRVERTTAGTGVSRRLQGAVARF